MYFSFPVLEKIDDEMKKQHNFKGKDIFKLDWWLASRKRNHWLLLNPLQFSLDCDVDESTAIQLFTELALNEDIRLLDLKAVIRCCDCNGIIETVYNSLNFTYSLSNCPVCNNATKYDELELSGIEIYFELRQEPIFKR